MSYRVVIRCLAVTALVLALPSPSLCLTRHEAAVRILELSELGKVGGCQIWMPDTPHGQDVFAWDMKASPHESPMPYPNSWFAMVDGAPLSEWAHPCFWIYLNEEDPAEYQVEEHEWYPLLYDDMSYLQIPLACVDVPGHSDMTPCKEADWGLTLPNAYPHDGSRGGAECVWASLWAAGGKDNNEFQKDIYRFGGALDGAGVPWQQVVYRIGGARDDTLGQDLKRQCGKMKARDSLVILIAGHGSKGFVQMAPYEPQDDQEGDNAAELMDAELVTYLQQHCSHVCRIFVFVASCGSGAFATTLTRWLDNAIVVTSCESDQTEIGGYWSRCIAPWIPGHSASLATDRCDYEVRRQVRQDHTTYCYWLPSHCRQLTVYRASADVHHEHEPIAFCCDPVTVKPVSWGVIKCLYR